MSGKRQFIKNKAEFSKVFCGCVAFGMFLVGVWMIVKYFDLVELAITSGSDVMPDAALPIAGISSIMAPVLAYLLYQAGLKNSRNKYGIDSEGQPFVMSTGFEEEETLNERDYSETDLS